MGSMQLAYGFAAGEPQPVLTPENDINRSRMAKYQTTVMAVKTMSTPAVGIQRTLNFAGATALPSLGGRRGYGLRLSKYRTAVMSLQGPLALAPSGEAQSAVLMPTRIQQRVVSRPKTSLAARVFGDRWLTILALVTVALSIGSTYYYLITNKILTYIDAMSHLMIARRVFDNATPGLAQLGGIWLPLPHVLMFPFVGNDYLWRTGLAGSLVGMICYFLAVIFLFLTARRITKNSVASFVGTLLFALNPNVLYMQSTPMSELVYLAMLCGTCFFYVAWIQDDDPKQLILAGIMVFLATLSRYDGWPVALALIGLTPVITFIRHRHFARAEAYTIILAIVALFGVAFWLLWCALIFHDPLYFQRSEFSAQAQQIQYLNNGSLYTYKNIFQSVRYFGLAGLRVSGALTVVLGALGCVAWVLQTLWNLVKNRSQLMDIVGAIIVFVPIAFNVYALYQGQTIIYLPEALPPGTPPAFFNTRYGLGLLPLAALAFPILFSWILRLLKSRNIGLSLGRAVLVLATLSIIAFQNRVQAVTDIVTLRDPMVVACQTSSHNVLEYLSTHYNGGLILGTAYGASPVYLMGPALGIPFRNIVYEGNNTIWNEVVAHPSAHVDWVMVNPTESSDLVARALKINDPGFQSAFNLVATDTDGYQLYRRHDALDVPRVATPNRALYQLDYCKSVS